MGEDIIRPFGQLSPVQQEEFVDIFIEGFGHLLGLKQNTANFKAVLIASVHPDNSYAYIKEEGVVGILLLGTNKLRPLKFNETVAVGLFGKTKGISMCRQLNGFFQSQAVERDTDLYIDVLGVSKKAEKQGIGSKLLHFAFAQEGFDAYYLDVLSKNEVAKTLYEKRGFVAVKKHYFSTLRLLGYGYPVKMKKGQ